MRNFPNFKKSAVAALVAASFGSTVALADPIKFAQIPPFKQFIPPVPNVLISIDDSAGMSTPIDPNKPLSKMNALRTDMVAVMGDKLLVPELSFRLSWQAMHNNGNSPGAGKVAIQQPNSMFPFNDAHRTKFLQFVNTLQPGNASVPTHRMMKQVYDYLKVPKSFDSPWTASPGFSESSYWGCRRTYHILLTGNPWNGSVASELPGEVDNVNAVLPDGKVYSAVAPSSNIYRGKQKDLLADWAMKMWQEDLQPEIPNEIKALNDAVPATETHGFVNLPKYWNPKHDPASWQHVVQFTVGIGDSGYKWTGLPLWSPDDDNYGAGGDYSKLVQGLDWPIGHANGLQKNTVDLWHTAINGRGKFYPVGPGKKYDIKGALKDIFNTIIVQNAPEVLAVSTSSSTNVRTDQQRFTSGYEVGTWWGFIKADKISPEGVISPDWGGQSTAEKLDALGNINNRLILTTNDISNKGISFEWPAGAVNNNLTLSSNQMKAMGSNGDGLLPIGNPIGKRITNFVRGDRIDEGGTPTKPFRIRNSRHGDIINSTIWYVDKPVSNYTLKGYKEFTAAQKKRLPMIYVGVNDGMLHGFSAVDGEEKIAYVPKGVIPELNKLTVGITNIDNVSAVQFQDTHRYYVDGSPFTGDLNLADKNSPPNWRTFLVGSLAAGGKGYFVLDVTNPTEFTKANAANLVVIDKTLHPETVLTAGSDDEDIGHIFHKPVVDDNNPYKSSQITMMNDGRWAVILGNGYNSKNERPVLIIQYLDGAKELRKIVATGNQKLSNPVDPSKDTNVISNGLSAPRPVDINGDNKADIVYAGDLKGNLWKFNLMSTNPTEWSVASWGADPKQGPLFTAEGPGGKRQPITIAPTVKANDRGDVAGMMVAFGTGENLTYESSEVKDIQSVYSIIDNTLYKPKDGALVVDNKPTSINKDRTELVEQKKVKVEGTKGAGVSSSREFWELTQNAVDYKTKKGWYFDFQEKERVLRPLSFFDGSNNLMIFSEMPAEIGRGVERESCEPTNPEEQVFLTLMNIMDGRKPGVQIMDLNGDGLYNSDDKGVSSMSLSPRSAAERTTEKEIILGGPDGKTDKLARMPEQPARPNWRQLR